MKSGLLERLREPHHNLPEPTDRLVVATKREKQNWGARKDCA